MPNLADCQNNQEFACVRGRFGPQSAHLPLRPTTSAGVILHGCASDASKSCAIPKRDIRSRVPVLWRLQQLPHQPPLQRLPLQRLPLQQLQHLPLRRLLLANRLLCSSCCKSQALRASQALHAPPYLRPTAPLAYLQQHTCRSWEAQALKTGVGVPTYAWPPPPHAWLLLASLTGLSQRSPLQPRRVTALPENVFRVTHSLTLRLRVVGLARGKG